MKRFKIGSKVEVLRKKAIPPGMWRSAEIIEENVVSYVVKYGHGMGVGKEGIFQRVPRECVRPCPPPMKGVLNWEVGDVVEVLDGGHWKVSMIVMVLGYGVYRIRLIGSMKESVVRKSGIRVRQVWSDNKWFVIGKDSVACKHVIPEMHERMTTLAGERCQVLPYGGSKRKLPFCSSDHDAYTTNLLKKREVEERSLLVEVLPRCSSLALKKDNDWMDAVLSA